MLAVAAAAATASALAVAVATAGCSGHRSHPPSPGIRASPPPPDPQVVGPRLILQSYGPELLAWRWVYRARVGSGVAERWHVRKLTEERSIVSLQLVGARGRLLITANWAIAVPLDRPLTPQEQQVAEGPHPIEAVDAAAQRLQSFPPPPRTGQTEVELPADVVAILPGRDRLLMAVLPAGAMPPYFAVRTGAVDYAFVRGQALLGESPSLPLRPLSLLGAAVTNETLGSDGRVVSVRRASLRGLETSFMQPVRLVLQWRVSRPTGLRSLLRRRVDGVVLLTKQSP